MAPKPIFLETEKILLVFFEFVRTFSLIAIASGSFPMAHRSYISMYLMITPIHH